VVFQAANGGVLLLSIAPSPSPAIANFFPRLEGEHPPFACAASGSIVVAIYRSCQRRG
jgi:hypothetical protein